MTPATPDYERIVRASFAEQGLMRLLGASITDLRPGRVAIDVALTPDLTQQAGYFHGGVIGAIADSAGGYAALSLMPAGAQVLTIEYKINFIRPAAGPLLRAIGEVVRPGRTISVARMECRSGTADQIAEIEPCAVLQASFIRLDPQK